MKGTAYENPTDWLEFEKPDNKGSYLRVHLGFMLSNWSCIYGQGCPGIVSEGEEGVATDIGCCRQGAHIIDPEDLKKVTEHVAMLTDEDWDEENRLQAEKGGWLVTYKEGEDADGEISTKTRVVNRGCIFANRHTGSVGSTGKIGCAFHHLGQRLGKSHTELMPDICWQLPLYMDPEDEDGVETLRPYDADQWDASDDWMKWWCIDTPDAYHSDRAVYITLEEEIRAMIGDPCYERLVELIKERAGNAISPMYGAVRNEGRPMIPLLIGSGNLNTDLKTRVPKPRV